MAETIIDYSTDNGNGANPVWGIIAGDEENAENGEITIAEGAVVAQVTGGRDVYGNETDTYVANNRVTITGGTVEEYGVTGGVSFNALAEKNTVIMTGGTVGGAIIGGMSVLGGETTENTVSISGGAVTSPTNVYLEGKGLIIGGLSKGDDSGDSTANSVTISNTSIGGSVVGGETQGNEKNANNNEVALADATINGSVYGGVSDNGSANENSVVTTDTNITGEVYGAYSLQGSGNKNIVTVNGGTIDDTVHGAFANETNENSVTVTSGTVAGIIGGRSTTGDSAGNSVIVADGTMGNVFGGRSNHNVKQNSVSINGGTVNGQVLGGSVGYSYEEDGETKYVGNGNAEGNRVEITDGKVTGVVISGVTEGASGDATGNSLTVSGGELSSNVLGGISANGNATGNTSTVNGGTLGGQVTGGSSINGDATDNITTINAGDFSGRVYAGYSASGNANNNTTIINGGTFAAQIRGGTAETGNAEGNSIIISGGTINESVISGRSGSGDAINNSVTLLQGDAGNPVFSAESILYGGDDYETETVNEVKTGNTLNLHTTGISVKNIANFENLNFYVQSDTAADATFLTLTDSENTDITATNIGVGIEGSDTLLSKDDKIVLINKTGGTLLTDETLSNNVSALQGVAAVYEFELSKQDDQTLIATLATAPETDDTDTAGGDSSTDTSGGDSSTDTAVVSVNTQTLSLSEARLAGLDFVNRGADLATGEGISSLWQATQNAGAHGFAALGGENSRTETGSHIDVKGAGLLTGIGGGFANNGGQFSVGGYFEAGKGSYDSYNDFTNADDVHANGDTYYYGVGVMAKQQFNSGWSIDGGVRAGKSGMDYYSSDLVDAAGTATSFSGKSTYVGANIGIGKTFAISEQNHLTPYVKALYTHYDGLEQKIAGSTFDFSGVSSLRTQLGARFEHTLSEQSQFYTNLAWEREFHGTAKGKVLGMELLEPTLEGNTGIVGVGMRLNPSKNFNIDLGVSGKFGNRRGVSAVGKFKYSF